MLTSFSILKADCSAQSASVLDVICYQPMPGSGLSICFRYCTGGSPGKPDKDEASSSSSESDEEAESKPKKEKKKVEESRHRGSRPMKHRRHKESFWQLVVDTNVLLDQPSFRPFARVHSLASDDSLASLE